VKIVTMNLMDLNPAIYNPRKLLEPGDTEYEQIKASIEAFGLVKPIIWNQQTKNIVSGHQTRNVLLDLGHETAAVNVIDIDEQKEKALNIALNKITGEWDDEKLAALLDELASDADEMLLSLSGFTESDMDELFSFEEIDFDDLSGEDDDFNLDTALTEVEGAPVARTGDIYVLGGKHRLMCGDACNPDDVASLMDGKVAKLIITDPPYNVDYEGVAGKMTGDCQPDNQFKTFLLSVFANIHNVSAPGAAAYIFHADTEGINFRTAFEESGFKIRQCLVWVKNSFVLGRQDYQWQHEPILYGWKSGNAHYFVDDRTQTTVVEHDRPAISKEHPTMKPVSLIERFVLSSSKQRWIILDLFGGSGSTLIAADKNKRICHTMEIDPKYCDVIIKRYIEHVGAADGVVVIRGGKDLPYSEVSTDG